MLSALAEAFLYVYIGVSAISIDMDYVIPEFITTVTIATAIARFVSVFTPMFCLYLLQGKSLGKL